MDTDTIIETAKPILHFLAFTAFVYICLYLLLIKKTKHFPTVLGDIGWKRVDYIWITIGSIGVITQIIQIQAQIVAKDLEFQNSLKTSAIIELNRAAYDLSDQKPV